MALFLISDTHFDDDNSIDYHIRPFNNTRHMNETMVLNWNRVVSHKDTVIFLGDFTGPEVHHSKASDWSSLLNGHKKFILGENDNLSSAQIRNGEVIDEYKTKVNGYNLYMTHDHADAPEDWTGWVVHGHSHQLHPQDYPLYNYQYKRVNVSAEQIGYTPIEINSLVAMIDAISEESN